MTSMQENIPTLTPLTNQAVISISVNTEYGNDWESFSTRAEELRLRFDDIRFDLGDLANDITTSFGAKGFQIFCKEQGLKLATMRRYRDVSRAIPGEMRTEFNRLSWSIFKMVAPYPNKKQLLEYAHDNNVSVEKMGMYLDEKITKEEVEKSKKPAKPEMGFCEICNKWYIVQDEEVCKTKGHHA